MTSFGRDIHVLHIHTETIQGFHNESTNQRVNDIGVHLLNENIEIGESNNINLKTLNLTNTPDDVERYSIGLSNSNFVIRDNVNEVDKMKIDKTTGVITFNPPLTAESSISNLVQLQDVDAIGITDGNILFYNSNSNNFQFHNDTNFNSSTIQIGHLYIDTINNRLGINVTNPEEDLEIDGNIQIDTAGLGRLIFYDKQADHEHVEIDGDDDGTTGGQFLVKVKQDGGSVTTRLNIRENGDTYFDTSNFFIKNAIGSNYDVLERITTNTTNISTNKFAAFSNTQSNLSTCNFIEDLSLNVASNTSGILTNQTNITSNSNDIISNSNYMVSLSNQQDINSTTILNHSNIISNVFTPYINLSDPTLWEFKCNVLMKQTLTLCNQFYLSNTPVSNDNQFNLLAIDNNTKRIFSTSNFTAQVNSNSNQILINASSIITNSLSITDLTSSNSDLCNRIDNIITSSNYSDITASNSQSNVSLCNQVDLNSQSNSNLCNYITNLVISNYDNITSSNSQSNSNLCNQVDLNSQSNSNLCNYITNLVISNYDDITSSNSQSNSNLCNQVNLNSQSNSNLCNYITNLVISNYDDITSSNSQSNSNLCNLADLNSQSNSNLCNYITNLVISNYDDITSSNSQSNSNLCNQVNLNSQSNSNLCNYITNLVISNYDDITSSNSQSNSNLCNQVNLNSQSNSNLCNYITNLVISNYDDITSSNSQSNSNLCNYVTSLSNNFNSNPTGITDYYVSSVTTSNKAMRFSVFDTGDKTGGEAQFAINLWNDTQLDTPIFITGDRTEILNDLQLGGNGISVSNYITNLCNLVDSNSQSNSNLYDVLTFNDAKDYFGYGDLNFHSFNTGYNTAIPAIAIGDRSLQSNVNTGAIGIGYFANNQNSGSKSIAIGYIAGRFGLGDNSIAIGNAAQYFQGCNNTIVISAENTNLSPSSSGTFIGPITNSNLVLSNHILQYNNVTKEISFCCNCNIIRENLDYIKTEIGYDTILSNSQSNSNLCNDVTSLNSSLVYNTTSNLYALGKDNFGILDSTAFESVALGHQAAANIPSFQTISIGSYSGNSNASLGAINIGHSAGRTNAGIYSICIGLNAGRDGTCNSTIVLNATGSNFTPITQGLFIDPITECNVLCNHYLQYDPTTKEISYASNCNLPSGSTNYDTITQSNSQSNSNLCNQIDTLDGLFYYDDISLNYGFGSCNFVSIDTGANYITSIGHSAGRSSVKRWSTNLGSFAGQTNAGEGSVNIGNGAGGINAGDYSINIGTNAGIFGSCNNTICLNASGSSITPSTTGFFVTPITESNFLSNHILQYNSVTKEISYTHNSNLPSGGTNYDAITQSNSQSNVSLCNYVVDLCNTVDTNQSVGINNNLSNSNLCNQIDSLSQSNVSLCNIQGVLVSKTDSIQVLALSNSQSNSNIFNQLIFDQTNANYGYGCNMFTTTNVDTQFNIAIGNGTMTRIETSNCIAIGGNALADQFKEGAIAIGQSAGGSNAGENSICLGNFAGNTDAPDNSIIINSTGLSFAPSTSGFFVNPIIQADYSNFYDDSNANMLYNFQTKEITYSKHRFSKFILGGINNLTTTVTQLPITSRQIGIFEFTAAGVITIPETGLYRVTASSLNQQSSGNNRTEITLYLYIGGTLNQETNSICYIRCQTGCGDGSCHYTNIVLLNQNDTISMRTARTDTSTTTTNVLRGLIILERLN